VARRWLPTRRRYVNPSPLHPVVARGPGKDLFGARRPRWWRVVAVAGLLAALAGAGLLVRRAASGHDAAPEGSPVPPPTGQASRGQPVAEAVVRLEDGRTHPDRVHVQAGDGLSLFVQNASTAEHHFIVGELGIHEDLQPGSSAQVIVSDLRPGTYRSWCAYADHREGTTFVVN
jgi:heme/copper-type cytochrome/quinol oxidase subunit 2